uniref:Ser/Thr-rich protein T10 in DGCR region n=1 Tax=Kalanchoe fedtschenkoi TaxID=63787 RepID=A0A7N0ZSR3_KALFE
MCIAVFMWKAHPLYPFFLLLNRDEFHDRDTKPLGWWEDGKILGGRDGVAGGTWLACSRDGRVAFVTNVRELQSLPQAKSRGHLPVRFLLTKQGPKEYAEEVASEADLYNGFNLIVADLVTKTMFYVTNRARDGPSVIEVPPGIHVLTNASLDTPWLKAKRLEHSFREKMNNYNESEIPTKELIETLMTNNVRDDFSLLPKIYPPEKEHQLSAIFVDCDTPLGRYGTRSTSAVTVKTSGELNFFERSGSCKSSTFLFS